MLLQLNYSSWGAAPLCTPLYVRYRIATALGMGNNDFFFLQIPGAKCVSSSIKYPPSLDIQ